MEQCGGGVGRNIAEALYRLRGGRARLLTAIGDDADGRYLEEFTPGLLLDGCVIKDKARTATYAAIFDSHGECLMGLGDMDMHNEINIHLVDKNLNVLKKAPLVVLDGNIPQNTMDYVLKLCHEFGKPVFFEPTDRRKATKVCVCQQEIAYASPNIVELKAMAAFLKPSINIDDSSNIDNIMNLSKIVSEFVRVLIVTMGSKGVIICRRDKNQFKAKHYSTSIIKTVTNVSGAGDCFASGFIHGVLSNYDELMCVSVGFDAAKSSLLCKNTVPFKLPLNKCEVNCIPIKCE